MYKLYALICPVSLEIKYIGVTKQTLERRLQNHIHGLKIINNNPKKIWLKNLIENNTKPTIIILKNCKNKEEAFILEAHFIKLLNIFNCDLTNFAHGNEKVKNIVWNQDRKNKLSEKLRSLNRTLTENHKEIIKERWKKNNFAKGSTRTLEQKQHLSNVRSISVLQYSKDGVLINEYKSAVEASVLTKIRRTAIVNNLSNNSKTAGGYIWKYK